MEVITKTYNKYTPQEFFNLSGDEQESCKEFHFTHGIQHHDELGWFDNNRVYLSSHSNGIVKYDDKQKQYTKALYGSSHPLGQLEFVVGAENDKTS